MHNEHIKYYKTACTVWERRPTETHWLCDSRRAACPIAIRCTVCTPCRWMFAQTDATDLGWVWCGCWCLCWPAHSRRSRPHSALCLRRMRRWANRPPSQPCRSRSFSGGRECWHQSTVRLTERGGVGCLIVIFFVNLLNLSWSTCSWVFERSFLLLIVWHFSLSLPFGPDRLKPVIRWDRYAPFFIRHTKQTCWHRTSSFSMSTTVRYTQ